MISNLIKLITIARIFKLIKKSKSLTSLKVEISKELATNVVKVL